MKFGVLLKIYLSHCVIFPLYIRNDHSKNNCIFLIHVLLFLPFYLCRTDHGDSIIDDSDSPVKTTEVSPSKEWGYCGSGDSNNKPDDSDSDDDIDASEDVRNGGIEQDPHHLASLLDRSNEIDGDSESDVSTDLIHPPRSR